MVVIPQHLLSSLSRKSVSDTLCTCTKLGFKCVVTHRPSTIHLRPSGGLCIYDPVAGSLYSFTLNSERARRTPVHPPPPPPPPRNIPLWFQNVPWGAPNTISLVPRTAIGMHWSYSQGYSLEFSQSLTSRRSLKAVLKAVLNWA